MGAAMERMITCTMQTPVFLWPPPPPPSPRPHGAHKQRTRASLLAPMRLCSGCSRPQGWRLAAARARHAHAVIPCAAPCAVRTSSPAPLGLYSGCSCQGMSISCSWSWNLCRGWGRARGMHMRSEQVPHHAEQGHALSMRSKQMLRHAHVRGALPRRTSVPCPTPPPPARHPSRPPPSPPLPTPQCPRPHVAGPCACKLAHLRV